MLTVVSKRARLFNSKRRHGAGACRARICSLLPCLGADVCIAGVGTEIVFATDAVMRH
jgi:hypothetical protein